MLNNIPPANATHFQDKALPSPSTYARVIMAGLASDLLAFYSGGTGAAGDIGIVLNTIASSTLPQNIKTTLHQYLGPVSQNSPSPAAIFSALGHTIQTLSTIDPNMQSADTKNNAEEWFSDKLILTTYTPAAQCVHFAKFLANYADMFIPKDSSNYNTLKADVDHLEDTVFLQKNDYGSLASLLSTFSSDLVRILTPPQ